MSENGLEFALNSTAVSLMWRYFSYSGMQLCQVECLEHMRFFNWCSLLLT